jgi:hypothetical protein
MRMRMNVLLVVLLLFPVACGTVGRRDEPCRGAIHVNKNRAFSVCVPRGWTLQDAGYWMGRHLWVFALIRNGAASGLAPGRHPEEDGWPLTELPKQMPQGGAIVTFSIWHGGPPPAAEYAHCMFSPDTVGDDLLPLLDTLRVKNEASGRTALRFHKWDDGWWINVFCRDPSRSDRRAIASLLRSIAFLHAPVASDGQASELAYLSLPTDERTPAAGAEWPCISAEVTQADSSFRVELRRWGSFTGNSKTLSLSPRTWSFCVHVNGSIERIQ